MSSNRQARRRLGRRSKRAAFGAIVSVSEVHTEAVGRGAVPSGTFFDTQNKVRLGLTRLGFDGVHLVGRVVGLSPRLIRKAVKRGEKRADDRFRRR